jgi:hypothetical protein
MKLLSERNPSQAEKNIKSVSFGPKINVLAGSLWDQATEVYFDGKHTAALLVGGVCAEAAHRFYCKEKGVSSKHIRAKWEVLIDYSAKQGILHDPRIGKLLHLLRRDYRNPWIHVNLSQISKKVPQIGMSKTMTAMIFSNQLALNCLWLTCVELAAFYGSVPFFSEPSIFPMRLKANIKETSQ